MAQDKRSQKHSETFSEDTELVYAALSVVYEEIQTRRVPPAGLTHPTCQFLRMCGEDRFHQQHRPLADPGGTVQGCHPQSVEMFHLKETTNLGQKRRLF